MQVAETKDNNVLTGVSIGFDIKATWLAISKMFNPLAAEHGITVTMGFVLLNIHEERGTAATKIAPLLGMEPRSLTRLLKVMEEEKLILRKPDPLDKRSVRIHLTPKGMEKKHIAMNNVGEFDTLVRKKISAKKLADFFDVLSTIYDTAEEYKAHS